MEKRKRSWISDNLPDPLRAVVTDQDPMRVVVADQIRTHRKDFFRVGAYERSRNFDSLRREEDWDAREYFQGLMVEKPHLKVLDSGAGWFEFSRDLKDAFGDSVFATALNPVFPIPPKNEPLRSQFQEKIRGELGEQEKIPDVFLLKGFRARSIQRKVDDHLRRMERVEENYGVLDDYHVSMVENFSGDGRQDVIVDLFGPLMYSRFPERILEVYFNETCDDGRVILGLYKKMHPNYQNFINESCGPDSQRAKETGFYFKSRVLAENIMELEKVKI
ncbi:MAG: hypothetical protein ABH851_05600 [Methanobacteriota archaeon]